jgi:hypothetical protein
VTAFFVFDGDLDFGVRSHPGNNFLSSALFKSSDEKGAEMMAQWHEFLCFISGVSNHESLISGSDVELIFFEMDGLGDVGALLIHCDNYDGGFVVHTDIDGIVADFFDGLSGNLFKVDFSLGADLAKYHADTVFDGTFTGDFGLGILGKACVKNGV